jgi:type II secretory pathway component PulF
MSRTLKPVFVLLLLLGVSAIVVVAFLLGGLRAMLGATGVLLLVGGIQVWLWFAFAHYRYIRQEEFLHLLTMAAESEAPLAPAMWSYANDRPHVDVREFWTAMLLLFTLPGYYWLWHRRHSFDYNVERVAALIDSGATLHDALKAAPGVAPSEAVLAAAIGEATGKLAACMRSVPRWRLATIWVDVVPRLVYPIFLLIFILAGVGFLFVFVIPKYEKIFADFKLEPPWLTTKFINAWGAIFRHAGLLLVAFLGLVALAGAVLASSTVCWYLPGLGPLYRMHARSRVLKGLALLLETSMPLPQALSVLYDSGFFPVVIRNRLRALRSAVERGEPLPENLYRCGLLPRHMLPLVQAAERAQTLPWAIAELGDSLAKRVSRLTYRLTMTVFPLTVMALGVLVGVVAVAMFWPLVKLLTEMVP